MTYPIIADVLGGLENAKTLLLNTTQSIIGIICAIGFVICGAFLIFQIISLVRVKRRGDEVEDQGRNIAITLAVMVLCGSYDVWLLTMIMG